MKIQISEQMWRDINDWAIINDMTFDEAVEYIFRLGFLIEDNGLEDDVEEAQRILEVWRTSIKEGE